MDYIAFNARRMGQRIAIEDLPSNRSYTYSHLDRLIACCCSFLQHKGVTTGDRVACLSRNCAEMIVLHHACARIEATFVPLNWRLSPHEIRLLLDDCTPRVLFGDQVASSLGFEHREISVLLDQVESYPPHHTAAVSPAHFSLLLYTSGTSGKPKGVMISELNISETAINFALLGEVNPASTFLCDSPMYHVIGMVTSIRTPLMVGGKLAISSGFEPALTLARLGDSSMGISHYFCVPQMAHALRSEGAFDPRKLRHLKAIFTGGAPHPAHQILEWVTDCVAIVDGYGSTECGTVFGMSIDTDVVTEKAGSAGVPTPRVEVRIVNAGGDFVPAGEAGELQIRGANVTNGYWQAGGEIKPATDEDGWFHTGDIARMDEDGFYFIVDRKKDMFISGGENVYPAEIEARLIEHPEIKEVAVVGVPDDRWGEVGCAYYVSDTSLLDVEAINVFLAGQLARYKLPKHAFRVDTLPRSGVGKVLKTELLHQFTATVT